MATIKVEQSCVSSTMPIVTSTAVLPAVASAIVTIFPAAPHTSFDCAQAATPLIAKPGAITGVTAVSSIPTMYVKPAFQAVFPEFLIPVHQVSAHAVFIQMFDAALAVTILDLAVYEE